MNATVQNAIPSQTKLVKAAQSGSHAAFLALVEPYVANLFAVALHVTRNMHKAEDAVQDGLLKAFVGIKGFRSEASIKTWLAAVVRNAALDMLRKKTEPTTDVDYETADQRSSSMDVESERQHLDHVLNHFAQSCAETAKVVRMYRLHGVMGTAKILAKQEGYSPSNKKAVETRRKRVHKYIADFTYWHRTTWVEVYMEAEDLHLAAIAEDNAREGREVPVFVQDRKKWLKAVDLVDTAQRFEGKWHLAATVNLYRWLREEID